MRILVVEDEKKMAALLRSGLEEEGHAVGIAHSAPAGLDLARTQVYDVLILDIMLPGFDGFEFVRRIRADGNRTPILILTARDSTADVVTGLASGADDYLKKPFSFDELLARLLALARRGAIVPNIRLQVEDLRLDPATHQVFRAGKRIVLTKKEFLLLEFLMRNAGRVLVRNTIIETVWNTEGSVGDNTLEAFIGLLRKKIDREATIKLIHTVRGFGYRLGKA